MKMLGTKIVKKNAKGPFSLGQGAGAQGGPRRRRTMVTIPMVCGYRPCCWGWELDCHGDMRGHGGQAEIQRNCLEG